MAGAPSLTFADAGGDAPFTIQLTPDQDIHLFAVCAEWEGVGASAAFHPCLSLYSPDDVLIARTRPETTFAVGDSGVVTYAPFLHSEGAAPPAVVGSLPYSILGDFAPYNGYYDVWRVIAGTATDLTGYADPDPFNEEEANPRLSPNGAWVAYQENFPGSGGGSVLDVVAAGGGAPSRIYDDAAGDWVLHPSWNPDSDYLLFIGGLGGGFAGKIMRAQRSNPGGSPTDLWVPQLQTPQRESAYRPHYSPDGTMVAFLVTLEAGGGGDPARQGLWVMNADGSGAALIDSFASGALTERGYLFQGTQLAWANGSDWIAYIQGGSGGGPNDLCKIQPDGTGKTVLMAGSSASRNNRIGHGAWTDDDSQIVYSQFTSGLGWTTWRVYRINADGTGNTELATNGPSGETHLRCAYRNPQDGRIYWISSRSPGVVRSCKIDGTDNIVTHAIAAISSQFYTGTGFEWL